MSKPNQSKMPRVLIIELCSQVTLLNELRLREEGYRSVICEPKRAEKFVENYPVDAIILSGGKNSVNDADAPGLLPKVREYIASGKVPTLCICYGMQLVSKFFGGKVERIQDKSNYAKAEVHVLSPNALFRNTPETQITWASHGDSVSEVPKAFKVIARFKSGGVAAIVNNAKTVWGVQFHPEVVDSVFGKQILKNFMRIAKCKRDWEPESVISGIQEGALSQLHGATATIGASGGVDSTFLISILSPVLKDRLLPVTLDCGNLREGEMDEIHHNVMSTGAVNWLRIDACAHFKNLFSDTTDAEVKRSRFKLKYAELWMKIAREFRGSFRVAFLQGTLAPDRIESGATGGALIKSHHNVGLKLGKLQQIHPMSHLFKYEVRALAQEIGLPESVYNRQPFPGPGLFIRTLHVPAIPENVAITSWADARTTEILKQHGVYKELSQLVVAYSGAKVVGVKGDGRVYGGTALVRAVKTSDFMTAKGVYFPEAVVEDLKEMLPKHPKIVGVYIDPTDKPPRTTEFE